LWQQQESAEFAARRRAAALVGLGGLLTTRVALAAFGLRVGYFAGCGAGAQGGIFWFVKIT
jgi:predicted ATPase